MTTAFDHAVKLLKGRSKSTAGLRAALVAKGYTEEESDATVARLIELTYLDDRRHGESRARGFFEEGRAKTDVIARLEADGLPPSLAADIAAAMALELHHSDAAAAENLLRKRKLTGPKAARFLLSRGFDESLVRRLCHLEEE